MQGNSISGYNLRRLLGTGGMAEVWYAENKIGKKAAVKIMLPKLCQDESLTSRFISEAKVMVDLSHPNIRQVYDFGEIEGRPAIVMEYLDGEDLKARMKRKQRFSDEQLHQWWNQLVDALNYTHAQGIIHRDIKPSNIFVDRQGDVKLLDFGIAKNNEGGSGTMTGSTLGTRIYMSPEQVKDPKRVSAATDAYSLAVTFVHLISGKAPYDTNRTSDYDIQVSIVNQPLDLTGLPAFWQQTLSPYLNKEASKRPALKPIGEQVRKNDNPPTSSYNDDGTLVEGMRQSVKHSERSSSASDLMLNSDAGIGKGKSNIVPWIIAAVAGVACVVLALFTLRGGGETEDNVDKGDKLGFLTYVNGGIQSANLILSDQISQKYENFENLYSLDPEKAGPYWEKAQSIRERATDLINYTEILKWDLVKEIEGKSNALEAIREGLLKSSDTLRNGRKMYDIDIARMKSGNEAEKASSYMLERGNASDLASEIKHFRDEMRNIMGSEFENEIGLATNSHWGDDNFGQKTLAEDVTTLNRIVSEVQDVECVAVTQLIQSLHANDFIYDEKVAKVYAESSYLLSGQTYNAQAMVTAWQNTKATALVSLDGGAQREYTSDAQGVINLAFNSGVGSHKYIGVIKMLNPSTKEIEDYPFENSFTVAPPAVSVSATKMNVVYRGIDNPIAVGGGVGGEISAYASSGTLTKTANGMYNFRPGEANEVTINVTSAGSSLGSMKFLVKDLPKPEAIIRNVQNGLVSKNALLGAGRVEAVMKDFDFDGVHYDVVGYTFRYKTKVGTTKEAKANSGAFTDEIRNAISSSNVGDTFLFTSILVRGNDGKTKTLDTSIGVEIK